MTKNPGRLNIPGDPPDELTLGKVKQAVGLFKAASITPVNGFYHYQHPPPYESVKRALSPIYPSINQAQARAIADRLVEAAQSSAASFRELAHNMAAVARNGGSIQSALAAVTPRLEYPPRFYRRPYLARKNLNGRNHWGTWQHYPKKLTAIEKRRKQRENQHH